MFIDWTSDLQMVLRWTHFVAGITWIGILYFFNWINGATMKSLEPAVKNKVFPELMARSMFYFRWGALVTWISGFGYFTWIITAEGGKHSALGIWLGLWVLAWLVMFGVLRPLAGALNKGIVVGIITLIVISVVGYVVLTAGQDGLLSSRSKSIGIGGGLGTIMLMNVWGIIWPAQKRIINWTRAAADTGAAMPPEAAKLGRRAFLASRMNTWLSFPMLWLMGAASHWPIFGA
jgi:uncharacterized membrane protein